MCPRQNPMLTVIVARSLYFVPLRMLQNAILFRQDQARSGWYGRRHRMQYFSKVKASLYFMSGLFQFNEHLLQDHSQPAIMFIMDLLGFQTLLISAFKSRLVCIKLRLTDIQFESGEHPPFFCFVNEVGQNRIYFNRLCMKRMVYQFIFVLDRS